MAKAFKNNILQLSNKNDPYFLNLKCYINCVCIFISVQTCDPTFCNCICFS